MTVLEAEEDTDKRSVPPRKKFCLSLSGRGRAIPIVAQQPPHTSVRGGLLDRSDFSFGKCFSCYDWRIRAHCPDADIGVISQSVLCRIKFLCKKYKLVVNVTFVAVISDLSSFYLPL